MGDPFSAPSACARVDVRGTLARACVCPCSCATGSAMQPSDGGPAILQLCNLRFNNTGPVALGPGPWGE